MSVSNFTVKHIAEFEIAVSQYPEVGKFFIWVHLNVLGEFAATASVRVLRGIGHGGYMGGIGSTEAEALKHCLVRTLHEFEKYLPASKSLIERTTKNWAAYG